MEAFILSHLPWFWVAVMLVCIVVEAASMALTTVWFALAALPLIFISALPLPFRWQILLWALISCALLVFTRPLAQKKLESRRTATNADALVGRHAAVTQRISPLQKGAVRLNGIEWTAAAGDLTLEPGTECVVQEIRGATAIVAPVPRTETEGA